MNWLTFTQCFQLDLNESHSLYLFFIFIRQSLFTVYVMQNDWQVNALTSSSNFTFQMYLFIFQEHFLKHTFCYMFYIFSCHLNRIVGFFHFGQQWYIWIIRFHMVVDAKKNHSEWCNWCTESFATPNQVFKNL